MSKLTSVLLILFIICAVILSACSILPDSTHTSVPTEATTTSPTNDSEPEFEAEFDDLLDIDVISPTQEETTEGTEEPTTGTPSEPTTPTTKPTAPTESTPTPTEPAPTETEPEAVPSPTDSDGKIVLPMIPG